MKALIDADIVAYRSAASAENDDVTVACIRAHRTLQDILTATDATEYKLYLTGSTNFRKAIYPEYKANRDNLKRPKWLQQVREYCVLDWAAEITDGIEADDAIGIAAGEKTVICSIDKDLLQIPGLHYRFVSGEWCDVDYITGARHFYSQLVLGDKGDNVPGFDGKMRLKFPKFLANIRNQLETATSPYSMYNVVKELYGPQNEEQLKRNGQLLHIWRKQNDSWSPPTSPETTLEERPEEVQNSESTATMPVDNIQSTGRGGMKQRADGSRQHGRLKVSASRKKRRARSTLTSKA